MLHRYAEWTRRQANSAHCHPALGVAGFIIAVCITGYIYRQVIFSTLIAAVSLVVIVGAVAACTAITVSTVRFLRAHRIAVAEAEPVPDTWTRREEPVTTLADERAIEAEADWLAGTGSLLVFDKDGNLRAAERK